MHRDLKPANVLVQPKGDGEVVLRVTDFGIGGVAAERARGETVATTAALGAYTPLYASPEQRRGERADPRDDVYSLGVIWYQLLTGNLNAAAPTGGAWKSELRRKGLSADALELLEACLEAERQHRPGDAAEMERRLRGVLEGGLPDAAVPAGLGSNRPSGRRRVLLTAAVGLTVVITGCLLGAWGLWWSGERRTLPPGTAARIRPYPGDVPREVVNSIGMKLRLIPAGTFLMGSPKDEQRGPGGNDRYDADQHEVEITRAFYLGAHEVTQQQYKAVMGSNPSDFSATGAAQTEVKGMNTDDFPVERVVQADAVEFCARLSELAKERQSGRVYRLPTEAEWEYACRAGSVTYKATHFGDSLGPSQANISSGRPCKVGSYRPNAWGLYDMHGNVAEWCADRYDSGYYRNSPRRDPPGPSGGRNWVIRGGHCSSGPRDCFSARRAQGDIDEKHGGHQSVGFRVVLVLSNQR